MAGAVVVVALAVIFVPMLFEGESPAPPSVDGALPPEPDFASRFEPASLSAPVNSTQNVADADLPVMEADLSSVESEPPALPLPSEVSEVDEATFAPPLAAPGQITQPDRTRRVDPASQPGRLDQPSAKPASPPVKRPAPTKPKVAAPNRSSSLKPTPTPVKQPAPAKQSAPAKSAATASVPAKPANAPAKTATPSKSAPSDGMSTWVVQVASLGSSQTAAELEKKLRDDGFSAFVEKAEVRGKTYYRVRVGPNADRASAEQTAGRLRQKQKVEPLVQRYQQ